MLCACVRESVRAFARRCRRWEGHTVVSKEDEPIGEANAAQPARVIVNAPRLFGPSVPHLTSAATEGGGTVSRASSRTAPETHTPSCRYTYVVVAALTTPPGGWGGGGSRGVRNCALRTNARACVVKRAWSWMVVVAVDSDASYQDEDESEDEDDDEDDDAHLDP